MSDILDRIDTFLNESVTFGDLPFVEKDVVVEVVDLIIEDVKEDTLLLNNFQEDVKENWTVKNKRLLESFYKILKFYGVIDGEEVTRKMVVEAKGKRIVRKVVNLKNKEKILKLL